MPELPDIELYRTCIRQRVSNSVVRRVRVISPFVLRTVDPPIDEVEGRTVTDVRRLGKRIILALDDGLFVVIHLMIAGRFRWDAPGASLNRKIGLASFGFDTGTLMLTESGTKRRAAIHVVRGKTALAAHDPGGIEPLESDLSTFVAAIRCGRHTIKRVLTDPRVIAGIGNAYSDEILFAARLSPITMNDKLSDAEVGQLFDATRQVLADSTAMLCKRFAERFPGPGDVTAFRPEFAVHGKFGKPCRVCGDAVQRIRYADNETNYCATCQTGGKLLADRSLSRLLGKDWPKTLDALEELRRA